MKHASVLRKDDLVLCAATIPDASFRERVDVAQKAGFNGISIFPEHYRKALKEEGLSSGDMLTLLNEHGLCIAEFDPLLDWVPALSSTARKSCASKHEHEFYEMAQALGGRSLNLALALEATAENLFPLEHIVSAFADVCDRAADYGLLVHLEFLPWSQIDSVETAFTVVEQAGRDNGGIMLDTWHHYRSRSDNAALNEERCQKIFAIQINDAPRQPAENLIVETLQRRLMPGNGDIDLSDIIVRLRQGGCEAPIGVEVFSTVLASRSVHDIAMDAGSRARKLISA